MHVKQIRDSLRLILRLAKTMPVYKDKSKLEGDHLVINDIMYGIDDLCKLLSELAPYKVAQKENESYIAFHGEMSPCSNFHRSPFTVKNQQFHSTEQWIQYQKVMLLVTASQQIRYWHAQHHLKQKIGLSSECVCCTEMER